MSKKLVGAVVFLVLVFLLKPGKTNSQGSCEATNCCTIGGDFNSDGVVDFTDYYHAYEWAFSITGPYAAPDCMGNTDMNIDGSVDISDVYDVQKYLGDNKLTTTWSNCYTQ